VDQIVEENREMVADDHWRLEDRDPGEWSNKD